jgi:hypothetical protein
MEAECRAQEREAKQRVIDETAVGHGIGGIDIPVKMAQLAKSLSQE